MSHVEGQVLILTHSADVYVPDVVADALERRGAQAVRVDTDRFPADGELVVRVDEPEPRMRLRVGGKRLDLDRCRAVWCRRVWTAAAPVEVDPRFAAACRAQASDAFLGALSVLEDRVPFVNRLDAQTRAERKILQLHAARRAGLRVPSTLVTNSRDELRTFLSQHRRVVTKMLVPLSQSMDGSGPFVYTNFVAAEDVDGAEVLGPAPMIFQVALDKREELRIVVVGERLFVAGVQPGALDWRKGVGSPWRRAELPRRTEHAIVSLVRSLGLTTASIDLLRDAQNELWFLDLNPAGEWGWLQRDLGLPIADALAETLLAPALRGVP